MTYTKAGVTFTTNNKPREVLTWNDLTAKEQVEFDYIDTEDKQAGSSFVRYRGWVYDLGQFLAANGEEWDGHNGGDGYFSAVYMRYLRDGDDMDYERVVMATATW
jgi:hypothetical protein